MTTSHSVFTEASLILSFLLFSTYGLAQCTPGIVTTAHTNSTYDLLLDPDGDGYITESGGAFSSGTNELAEFEILPNSTTGWIEIIDVNEISGDVTPNCGNSDLIQDDDGGSFGFYNIVDPTPGTPSGGDEYIIFRFRLAQSPNGNFGYNFLFDNNQAYGGGVDGNSTCGNLGFEREVQFANAGGKKGVSVYDIDGNTAFNSTLCNQCVDVSDVQEACAASSGNCGTTDPQFISFAVPLSHIGVGSDILISDLYIVVATASSGNGTSVLGGGNVTDMGALDGGSTGCACSGLSGCALFDCQTNCINTEFQTLPVELSYFSASAEGEGVSLTWETVTEQNNSHFEVEHSTNGLNFSFVTSKPGQGTSYSPTSYSFFHQFPEEGLNYYRIKQVDFDGTFQYSDISVITVEDPKGLGINLYPSLANNQIQLDGLPTQQFIQVMIYDFNGRLRKNTGSLNKTLPMIINIEDLEAGTYIVKTKVGARDVIVNRFTKVNTP